MAKYIDKSALVAEIDRRIKVLQNHPKENHKTICHLDAVKQFLDTLEVKEVGLDLGNPDGDMGVKTVWDGDKIVSSKTQKGE